MKTTMLWAVAVIATVFFTGCKDYVGKEKTHPLFVKAGQAKQAGKPQEAAAFFRDFLDVCPRSPLAHYEIATVYGDSLDDPLKALYHYECFLELSPKSSDAENVRKFAEAARKKLYEKLAQIYPPKVNQEEQAKLQKLQTSLDQYIRYSQELLKQNQRMREMIQSGKIVKKTPAAAPAPEKKEAAAVPVPEKKEAAAPAAVQTSPEKQKPAPAVEQKQAPAVASAPKKEPAAADQKTETPEETAQYYVVQPGDSLSKISMKFYKSKKYYRLISQANKLRSDSIYAGQKLLIPKLNGN